MTEPKKVRAKRVLLIDAYNLIYRAYHGSLVDGKMEVEVKTPLNTSEELAQANLKVSSGEYIKVERDETGQAYSYHKETVKVKVSPTKTRDGMPNSAIYMVGTMLKKIRKDFFASGEPGYCLAVFDGGGDNFRKDLVDDYKGNRAKMPEDLRKQMPYIEKMFELLGFPISRPRGVEADDVIGAIAKRAGDLGYRVDIVSTDKDFRQIISDNVLVHDKMHDITYDKQKVFESMGVSVDNVVAFLALKGDSSDNVQGVAKWGDKTVAKYIDMYGSLEGIIAHADDIKGVIGDNLRAAIADGSLDLYRQLVTLKLDVELPYKNSDMTPLPLDKDKFDMFCYDLSLLRLQYNKFTEEKIASLQSRPALKM